MSASHRLLALLILGAGCARPVPPPTTTAKASDFEPRPSYPRTLEVPEDCEWPLELEQLVCAIDTAITQPSFDKARRGCAERHMAPLRKELAAYARSSRRLDEIRAQRSKPLAMGPRPPGLGPDPTRNPEEPLGSRSSNEREAERDQRAEIERQEEEVGLRSTIERSQQKLSEVFRYVEPCLDARIPFQAAPPPPPPPPGSKPASSGAEEML